MYETINFYENFKFINLDDSVIMNSPNTTLVGTSCKRISGIVVSENQNIYYSMIIYLQNSIIKNYVGTTIYKTTSNFTASGCNLYSFAYEGNN